MEEDPLRVALVARVPYLLFLAGAWEGGRAVLGKGGSELIGLVPSLGASFRSGVELMETLMLYGQRGWTLCVLDRCGGRVGLGSARLISVRERRRSSLEKMSSPPARPNDFVGNWRRLGIFGACTRGRPPA